MKVLLDTKTALMYIRLRNKLEELIILATSVTLESTFQWFFFQQETIFMAILVFILYGIISMICFYIILHQKYLIENLFMINLLYWVLIKHL